MKVNSVDTMNIMLHKIQETDELVTYQFTVAVRLGPDEFGMLHRSNKTGIVVYRKNYEPTETDTIESKIRFDETVTEPFFLNDEHLITSCYCAIRKQEQRGGYPDVIQRAIG